MFTEEMLREIGAVAEEFGLEPAALLAIAEVESGGRAFAVVEGRSEPLIRFEGHYFDRRLSEANRAVARAEGLASPQAGAVVNPATQAARWRLLARAAKIDHKAAHESVSWGLGQVMGSHWAWLGFGNIDALVSEARSGAAGQVRLMARYIEKAGLAASIGERDWEAFARGYNGPAYQQLSYHLKIAAAYQRHATAVPIDAPDGAEAKVLREGFSGDAVRDLQRSLSALGYPLRADGVFGQDTQSAVKAFQRDYGLTADGIAGPKTLEAIAEAMPFGGRSGGFWASLHAWLAAICGRLG